MVFMANVVLCVGPHFNGPEKIMCGKLQKNPHLDYIEYGFP